MVSTVKPFFSAGPRRFDHAEEAEEEQQAEEGEAVDQRRAVEAGETAAEEMRERNREEQAADHGAGGVGDLEDGGAPGDGVDEVLLGDERWDQRAGGGAAEAAAGADDEEDGIDQPDVLRVVQREPEQGEGGERLHGVAGEDDGAAVVAVGDMAGGEHEEDAGKEEREAGVSEGECGVGDLVDLPGDADGLGFGAHDAHEAGSGVETEVSRLPCNAGAGRLLGGIAHLNYYADTVGVGRSGTAGMMEAKRTNECTGSRYAGQPADGGAQSCE